MFDTLLAYIKIVILFVGTGIPPGLLGYGPKYPWITRTFQ